MTAVATAAPVTEWRPHPGGAEGAKVSLEKCSERVRKDYIDPLVVAFSRRVLNDRRDATSAKGKAQALLDAMKSRARYILDPSNAEYIASARLILCLDSTQKDYCHAGGDCDELTCTMCSMLMSVGIDCKLVGQSFTSSKVPTHVLLAAFDPQSETWFKIDPSTSLPVGRAYPASSEVEVDPLTGAVPDFSGPGPAATFVGVGMVPARLGALGAPGSPFAQANANLTAMMWAVKAGDMYRQAGEFANAIGAYQAAGNAGATVVGPDIDLAGAPSTTQPITQQAWALNGRLNGGLWLIGGQLVPLSASPTLEAATAAASAVKQMIAYYQQAIAVGTAAVASATKTAFPGPDTSTNTIIAWTVGLGIAAGLGWAVWRSHRPQVSQPAPPARLATAASERRRMR